MLDEPAAFETLFRHYHPRLVRFLSKLLDGTSVDPEDVAQESMVKAWTKRDQFDRRYQLSTWVYTIARRTAMDHLRKQRTSEDFSHLDRISAADSAPVDSIAARESAENLWQIAQRTLSSDQHSALWLRYGEDMTIKEVAKTLSKSTVSTRVLLHRARVALAPHLNPNERGTESRGDEQR